ncbi:MAG: hypothetical protein AB7U23_12585 [Dehalococcoidia bacterium]
MDGAEYRCVILVRDPTGSHKCDAVVKQNKMPHHLITKHKMDPTIEAMLEFFVLHRASTHGTRGSRGKVDDTTEPLFDRKDFR